jgi:hypothetical protein
MSSACAVVIIRGLELVRLGSDATAYLAVIASGNYRLLPYAIEFWIDHCSQYALGGGCLGLDRPLQRHLARLYEKHKDILHALRLAIPQAASPERAMKDHANEQIKLYSNIPIYGLMAEILSLRQLVSQLDGDNSSGKFRLNKLFQHEPADELTWRIADIEAYVRNNDRTLFSRLAHAYESAVVHLLAQHEVPGITPTILRAFQKSYASTAFRCRFPHCERLSLGFATAELRAEHETIHIQRLYCQTISCQYNRIGFGKRSALNAHTRKHHGQSNVPLIPAKLRRTIDAEAETGDAKGYKRPRGLNYGYNHDPFENFDSDEVLHGADASDALVGDFDLQFPESPAALQPQSPVAFELPQWNPDVNNDVAHANLTSQPEQILQHQPLTEQARLDMLPVEFGYDVKRQLLRLPESEFRTVLQDYAMNFGRDRAQDSAFDSGQQNLGQQNVPDSKQWQRMLFDLEKQNKKRLLQARMEQDEK